MSELTVSETRDNHSVGNHEKRLRSILFLLLAFGLIMTFDLAYSPGSASFEKDYIANIAKFIGLAIFGLFHAYMLRRMTPNGLAISSHILMPLGLMLLIATALWGIEIQGAKRWLPIFGISFQTSEFFKFGVALGLAYALTPLKSTQVPQKASGFLKTLFWIELVAGLLLIYKQPNHSAVIIICAGIFIIALLSRVRWFYVVGFGLIVALILGSLVMKDPEKSKRIRAFLHKPTETENVELSEERFQAKQARLAVASGGWFGRGIGRSIAKYSIPAASTDFVFAIIVEEFGFTGGLVIILCFFVLILTALGLVGGEENEFLRLSTIGLTLFMTFSVVLHIAVNLDLLPTTGVPLPLISQGGSSLIFNLLSMGLIFNVARRRDLETSRRGV